jgi:hypothetical protein
MATTFTKNIRYRQQVLRQSRQGMLVVQLLRLVQRFTQRSATATTLDEVVDCMRYNQFKLLSVLTIEFGECYCT